MTNADIDTISTNKIDKLCSKSQRVKELSLQDRIQLVDELLSSVTNLESTNDWITKELILIRKITEEDAETRNFSSHVNFSAAVTRNLMCDSFVVFLRTLKESLEYEYFEESMKSNTAAKVTPKPKPKLLSLVRDEETPNGKARVHGPVPIPLLNQTFEAWCKPKSDEANENTTSDAPKQLEGGIALVLGAGNASQLTVVDSLQCFFLHPRKPVLIKHHPLRPYLLEVFNIILEPLIRRGYVDQILDQGVQHIQNSLLTNNNVNAVHVTGAFSTANSIKNYVLSVRPNLTKEQVDAMLTSELGSATPCILSPGIYTDKELRNTARLITTGKKMGGGTFCLATQVVCLPSHWEQKDTLCQYLIEELNATPTDACYYPGSVERCAEIVNHYKQLDGDDGDKKSRVEHTNEAIFVAEEAGKGFNQQVSIVHCGTFGQDGYDGTAVRKEAFGPVLAIVELPSENKSDEAYMLDTAMPFINNKDNIFGSLSGTLICPASLNDSIVKKTAAAMRYGTVAINTLTAFGYSAMLNGSVWCGHPSDETKKSGNGYVGNHFSIPDIEKTVVYGPSLSTNPILDKKVEPPTLILDALYQVTVSPSKFSAFVSVVKLLIIRSVSSFLPKWIKGKLLYGAAV